MYINVLLLDGELAVLSAGEKEEYPEGRTVSFTVEGYESAEQALAAAEVMLAWCECGYGPREPACLTEARDAALKHRPRNWGGWVPLRTLVHTAQDLWEAVDELLCS